MDDRAGASGRWQVREGEAESFIDEWRRFLGWTRDHYDELISATLFQSEDDPNRFVSFAIWEGSQPRREWKDSAGFMTRFTACRELCDEFEGGDFLQVAHFSPGK
jgi:heme-degrading monooxygenase HmoA